MTAPGCSRRGCHLVWATTGMNDASDVIAPRLGLPVLRVVDFPDVEESERGLRWKSRFLVQWEGGRQFIWVDAASTRSAASATPISGLLRRWIAQTKQP